MTDYSGISSTVQVGELLRYINNECVKAARRNEQDEIQRLADLSDTIERALKQYQSGRSATNLQPSTEKGDSANG